MQISMIFLLVGLSASFAMPTTTTAEPQPSMKDAVRMLLETSQLLQNWGNTVLDASEIGLNGANVEKLTSSGSSARQRFHDTVQQVSGMIKENGSDEAPDTFHKDIAEGAVEMLKEEAKFEEFTEDDKLALIAGDKLSADTMRLRINMHLFSRSMEVMEATVSDLEALLTDDVTDTDIKEVLPELIEELGSEGTALSIVFKAIEESFDDAVDLMEPFVVEELKDEFERNGIEVDVDDDAGDDDDDDAKDDKKDDAPSRQRRSPFKSNSRSTFGRGGSSSSFGRGGSSSSFGRSSPSRFGSSGRSSSGFNRDLGRGWSVGTGGLSWSNRRGNVHFNAKPTFGRGGIGAQAGIRIEF